MRIRFRIHSLNEKRSFGYVIILASHSFVRLRSNSASISLAWMGSNPETSWTDMSFISFAGTPSAPAVTPILPARQHRDARHQAASNRPVSYQDSPYGKA